MCFIYSVVLMWQLIGRPFLPPYWALGFQLSRWGYNNLPNLKRIIQRNRAASVPQDVQTLDIDYMRFRQNFVVDFEEFAGLEAYVQELKRDGIRTVIILVRRNIFFLIRQNNFFPLQKMAPSQMLLLACV